MTIVHFTQANWDKAGQIFNIRIVKQSVWQARGWNSKFEWLLLDTIQNSEEV